MFLLGSLAISPLRRIARFGGLIDVRRMIGVGASCYIAAHLTLYIADQRLDLVKVASEIVHRIYLTIGFTALTGLAVLAATSTDRMVRRLGSFRWRRLHQTVYVIGLLGLIHYFQQTKADVSVPTFAAGVFGWLMVYRLLCWWREVPHLSTAGLVALAIVAAALTFAGEAIGIGIAFGVSPLRVLATAFDFDPQMIRPGWLVLASALAVAAVDFVRARGEEPRKPPPRLAGNMLATVDTPAA